MTSQLTKVRKVKPSEWFYEEAQRDHGALITCYWLKLGSNQKLKEDEVEEALWILFRNVDILSLCIREEEDDVWFCRMEEEIIDFKVIRDKSPSDVFDEERHRGFNSKCGPLWRAKYIINSNNNSGKQTSKPKLDETNKQYEYCQHEPPSKVEHDEINKCCQHEPPSELVLHENFKSDIIFSLNHAITDGYTVLNICKNFLELLNDVIGADIKKSYKFGKFNDGSETDEFVLKRLNYLKENPILFNQIKADISLREYTVLHELFPVPEVFVNRTNHIARDLDKDMTIKLTKKFKANGISFHSGFTALVNWALIEVLKENGYSKETLQIAGIHPLNLRRYWKKHLEIQQGCHVTECTMITSTEVNVGDRFWHYAQDLHNILNKYISENRPFDEMAVKMQTSTQTVVLHEEGSKNPLAPKLYYCSTNMGDLTSLLPGRGKHVSINWLTRCTSQYGSTCMTHIMQTYEGKFLYALGYYTKFVTDDFAHLYIDKIFDKIYLLCK